MNILSRTATALLLVTPLATARQQAPRPDFTQWTPLDRVMLAVNTDALTLNAINRKVGRLLAQKEISTEAELDKLWNETLHAEKRNVLTRQAGEDMGLDPQLFQAISRSIYEEEVEQQGGVGPMGTALTIEGMTARQKQEQIASDVSSRTWKNAITGRDVGAGGRAFQDRFVRPSRLRQIYRRMKKTGAHIEALQRRGARPALYDLQALLLEGRIFGSLKAAEERAVKVREELERGEIEWEAAVDEIGSLPNRGVLGPMPMQNLEGALDPGNGMLVGFLLEKDESAYSSVMPFAPPNPTTGERRVEGYVIYRLLNFQPAEIPEFTGAGVQQDLTRFIQFEGDERLFAEGLSVLEKDAYVWFAGIEEQRKQHEEAEQEKERQVLETRERNAEAERARKGEKVEEKPPQPEAVDGDSRPQEAPGDGS